MLLIDKSLARDELKNKAKADIVVNAPKIFLGASYKGKKKKYPEAHMRKTRMSEI